MKLSPFFDYFGAKWVYSKYAPRPLMKTIVEPFAGSACYSLHYPEHQIILNDINPVVCGVWDYLINVSEDEIMKLPDFVNSIEDLTGPKECKDLVGFSLAIGRARPSPKATPMVLRNLKPTERLWHGWNLRRKLIIARQLKYIRHWKIQCGSYKDLPDMRATWFIDPPYNNKAGKTYVFNKMDYRDLADWCKGRSGQVIVCEEEGADWLPFTKFRTMKATRGKISEVFWYKNCGGSLVTVSLQAGTGGVG